MLFTLPLVMDYRKVQMFLTAVRCGSLTEAAAELELSQPPLSKSINALAKSLRVTFPERGPLGVRPPPFRPQIATRGLRVGLQGFIFTEPYIRVTTIHVGNVAMSSFSS